MENKTENKDEIKSKRTIMIKMDKNSIAEDEDLDLGVQQQEDKLFINNKEDNFNNNLNQRVQSSDINMSGENKTPTTYCPITMRMIE